jgi:hypothetical protein
MERGSPANQATARCVVAKTVIGARTVRRRPRHLARCADLSRIARGKFRSCCASGQIMGGRCDCSDPNRILAPLPAPGIAVPAASCLARSCFDVPGPLELHFHRWRFLSVFFARFDQVKFLPSGIGILFVLLFSMFLVTLDVERIGAAFLKGETSCNDLNTRAGSSRL